MALRDAQKRKEDRKTARALERDRALNAREIEQALKTTQARINAVEKQAQKVMEQKTGGKDPLKGIARIFASPGLKGLRPFGSRPHVPEKRLGGDQNRSSIGSGTSKEKTAGKDGSVSFHFSVTSISKGGELAAVLKGRKSLASARSSAAPHQKYIERSEAAEQLALGEIDTVIATPAVLMQQYIEDGNLENTHQAINGSDGISSFGNISKVAEERVRFWTAVEAMEQNPADPVVTLDPICAPEVWERIKGDIGKHVLPKEILTALQSSEAVAFQVSQDIALEILAVFRRHKFQEVENDEDPEGPGT